MSKKLKWNPSDEICLFLEYMTEHLSHEVDIGVVKKWQREFEKEFDIEAPISHRVGGYK